MKKREFRSLLKQLMKPHPLELQIGYHFQQNSLLLEALTHSSATLEVEGSPTSNERLEFLGDAVLQLVITEHLFELFPELQEGPLTKIRIRLVSRDALNTYATKIKLGQYLILGHGEESNGGRHRASILGNAFEALTGAIFLDGGIEEAKKFILIQAAKQLQQVQKEPHENNPKGELQEILQAAGKEHPTYTFLKEKEESNNFHKIFNCHVTSEGHTLGFGQGSSKKLAEIAAAQAALQSIKSNIRS